MSKTILIVALCAAFACKKAEPVATSTAPTDADFARKTMQSMRAIATAWEAYATDNNSYNAAGYEPLGTAVHFADVEANLVPKYIKFIPENDGWGNPFAFRIAMSTDDTTKSVGYEIISFGKNGTRDPVVEGETTDPNLDIIYSMGHFVSYPKDVPQY